MGWDYWHVTPGTTTRAYVAEAIGGEVLDVTTVGNTAYAAVRADGEVSAVVVLLNRKAGGYWGCKIMDEAMGPYYYGCPGRILDLLSPTANPTASAWRSKCRQYAIDRTQTTEEHATLQVGDALTFERGVKTFVLESVGRTVTARGDNGRLYRITPATLRHPHTVTKAKEVS